MVGFLSCLGTKRRSEKSVAQAQLIGLTSVDHACVRSIGRCRCRADGGSNRAGGPNDIILSDVGKSVVLVGIRYRLGIFGFLSHPALTSEQGGSSGNYGLMDQIAALQWVQRNIEKFGGDPAHVTIAGESAGSQDVSLMLAAPAAAPLLGRALMESGTPGFGMPFRSLRDAERIGQQADSLLGAGGDIAKLRQ